MPNSLLVLMFAFGLFLFAMFVSAALVEADAGDGVLLSVLVSVMGYVLYWIVLAVTGFASRLLPTVSSIMACGSILTVLMVAAFVMLSPFIGGTFASTIASLILIWSVPVKGHIIARAIEQHWYIGICIAMAIFIMQRVAFSTMMAPPATN